MARLVDAVLCDLLLAVMDSVSVWAAAAGDPATGLAWRDAVTARMIAAGAYLPYERLVADEAVRLGLPVEAPARLFDGWHRMEPRPDARALVEAGIPYAFVTNTSRQLAELAAERSGLTPRFTLSGEESGWYKPRAEMYVTACRRMGTEVARTLFVAGAAYDAEGARRAGLPAVLVLRRPLDRPLHGTIRVAWRLEDALPAR
ncbi:MAG TPA: HAD-IA family hydrolase [candidate division Zixibacteria bacterium]|nr:HAD-IA family hydrolase [candidate division Zixibacteria bacterium]